MSSKAAANIKTVIIVVLFLTTILLLYLIWGGSTEVNVSDLLSTFSGRAEELEVGGTVHSTSVVFSKGDGSFRSVSDDVLYYYRTVEMFKSLCDHGTVIAGEITRAQFEEAVKDRESIILSFGYSIPFSQYCSFNGIKGNSTFDSIANVSVIALSAAAQDSCYIADEKNGRYYRLVSDNPGEAFAEPDSYAGDISYYELNRVFGGENRRLFPIVSESTMTEIPYTQNYGASPDERYEIARALFGDTLDFVRRISDSFGNYTYMYGYGQKTLTLSADGTIEYKAEISSGNSNGFYGDLKTAMNFAENAGGFSQNISSTHFMLVLGDVQVQGSGKSAVHTFRFFLSDSLHNICSSDGNYAVEITVEKGKVSAYKSNIVSAITHVSESGPQPIADAANVLASGCADADELAVLLNEYKSMEQVYYKKDGMLIPAWRLLLSDGSARFYDLYTGEVLE